MLQEISESVQCASERVGRVFQFIAALYQHRNPAPRQISEQQWLLRTRDVPQHEAIVLGALSGVGEAGHDDPSASSPEPTPVPLLVVRRAERTAPPEPPEVLRDWLNSSWRDCRRSIEISETLTQRSSDESGESGVAVRFGDDQQRISALERYGAEWNAWASAERITLQALDIFEQLYQLYGTLQRDGERYELVVGNGLLSWRRDQGGVRFPILTKRVDLMFEPEVPEFRIMDGLDSTNLDTALFRSMPDVEGRVIGSSRAEIDVLDVHPFGGIDLQPFLKAFAAKLSAEGRFSAEPPSGERDYPQIGLDCVFFLRRRTTGLSDAIQKIIESLNNGGEPPTSLCNVVGIAVNTPPGEAIGDGAPADLELDANEDAHVLLTKEANREQLKIARALDRDHCVLVQGPPGTGKTHTIANLLGHLLSEGKSVLVTSHTTKALKVLREKVVEPLRPLCLSVLDDGAKDNEQLKSSVEGIVARLGSDTADSLDAQIRDLTNRRNAELEEVRALRKQLLDARLDERRSIAVGQEGYSPIEAAKIVAASMEKESWIPGPVQAGAAAPLSDAETYELFRTNEQICPDDEAELIKWAPHIGDLAQPTAFAAAVSELCELREAGLSQYVEFWQLPGEGDAAGVEAPLDAARKAIDDLRGWPRWIAAIVEDMEAGNEAPWRQVLDEIATAHQVVAEGQQRILAYDPQLPDFEDDEAAANVFEGIANDVSQRGKPPSFLSLLTHPKWKRVLQGVTILGGQPSKAEHFQALASLARTRAARDRLRGRWNRQIGAIGGPEANSFGERVEAGARNYIALISAAMSWRTSKWDVAIEQLRAQGLDWEKLTAHADIEYAGQPYREKIEHLCCDLLLGCAKSEWARRRARDIASELHDLQCVTVAPEGTSVAQSAQDLRSAVAAENSSAYERAYQEIRRLDALRRLSDRRENLLAQIHSVAPAWEQEIRARLGFNGRGEPPCSAQRAWTWRQCYDELDRRHNISIDELTQDLERHRKALHELTALLVDAKAWRAQIERTNLEQRQALMGFAGAKKRIGKGTGKRTATYVRMARDLMTKAQTAVPVWIMPLVKVAEMYDPRTTRFDVVIIDEASQSDITGLFAFYLGKQIIVVGDDEQVSPSAVGEEQDILDHLIDEFLQGIPNANLFGGRLSIYDLAKQSFSGTIALREHFRCVPEIISFSNKLSYGGSIKPLRERSADSLAPPVIAQRVSRCDVEAKINEREAREVAALVKACIEQPEYHDKTFGVISLVGDRQAQRIETLIRSSVHPTEIERRKLLAGSAAQFQGDERNVMFLSLVDVGSGTPLALRERHEFQQRYNVAASRAQDQMWVVYSMDPATDLKPDDLRRRLIEHALDPDAGSRAQNVLKAAESPFEEEVMEWLLHAGYRILPQYPVGAYRIDMVVQADDGSRAALECDGERYHRREDLERDLERQAILERVGWRFVRLRGSEYYRDKAGSMERVRQRLTRLGVPPALQATSIDRTVSTDVLDRVRRRAREIVDELVAEV